jgi:hypothetical protein
MLIIKNVSNMKEFLFVFRGDIQAMSTTSPEEMQRRTKTWMDWIGGIAAQNQLVDKGNRLMFDGKVLRQQGVVTDGPYTEIKESILGYSLVKAGSYNEAVELAKGCPLLYGGGNVEVREIRPL